ncbi:molybdenum cofactor guanylyltransferase MobA [Pseudomonas typographi]|uniref:Molybdenum cofactor guanylyltransferase n=1 Tax=Pseudomonas typographi TaxID=2715964 RepID=A0ABR7Z4C1_9PSED|nr:molybdenum cofactor guanylyltransferase MobA [Pseudomonas typographi]MBD1553236.1 molybdenum cofactor guanylyltransferase MobA [Pseudomonas typographi]MBD1588116.1 molybdenum cofactor guanylyltransferase MobA [Pseudomonas typographi]MBD1600350.1 molybdenum cofactor guanylyltransferase MobA [Pseudomonas typographi]
MPTPPLAVSTLLLAGGQGQRVGGQDKGLLQWHGQPLISYLYQQVRPLTDDLIISCNRNESAYSRYADRLVGDAEEGFPGPMAGLLAGLAAARHPWLLVLPCDVPGVDAALLQALLGAAQRTGGSAMVRQGGQWEPLLCVMPTRLRGAFEHAWQAGERSPRRVLLAQPVAAVDCAAGDPRLANLNTLGRLEAPS